MYSIVVRSRTALAASSAKENTPAPSMKESATGKKKNTLNKSGGPRRPTSAWPVQQLRRLSDKLRLVGVSRARPASEHKTIYESPSDASTIMNISSTPLASSILPASTSGASVLLDTLGSLLDMADAAPYRETQNDGTLAAGTSCDLLASFLAGREHLAPPPTPRLPSTPRFASAPRFEDAMLLAPPSPFASDDMLFPQPSSPLQDCFTARSSLLTPPATPRLPSTPRF